MEKNQIVVRQANRNDISKLIKNRMDFIYSLKKIMPPKIFEDLTCNYLNNQLEGENFKAWIALDGEEVISACMLCITEQIPTPITPNGRAGYIYNVYTCKEYRGQGYATRVLKEVQKYAAAHGILSVRLQATEDGFSVYERLGFKVQTNEMLWTVNACPTERLEDFVCPL